MKKMFLSLGLLLTVSLAIVVFNSCEKDNDDSIDSDTVSLTSDEGVVINGVKWATRNVDKPGTFTAKPEDAGMFYQWNRKVGWSATDPMINSNGGTEWNNNSPAGIVWEKANDPSPAGWRVPTLKEIQKLLDTDKVTQVWTAENGKNGCRFTDKTTNKSIFLPTAGYRYGFDSTLYSAGLNGYYWSSTTASSNSHYAYVLYFNSNIAYCFYWYYRNYGQSVRSVADN